MDPFLGVIPAVLANEGPATPLSAKCLEKPATKAEAVARTLDLAVALEKVCVAVKCIDPIDAHINAHTHGAR